MHAKLIFVLIKFSKHCCPFRRTWQFHGMADKWVPYNFVVQGLGIRIQFAAGKKAGGHDRDREREWETVRNQTDMKERRKERKTETDTERGREKSSWTCHACGCVEYLNVIKGGWQNWIGQKKQWIQDKPRGRRKTKAKIPLFPGICEMEKLSRRKCS